MQRNRFKSRVSAAITSTLISAAGLRAEAHPPATHPAAAEQAELLGGVFGSGACGITFSADGATAYFGGRKPGGGWAILVSHRVEGEWTQAEVAPFCRTDTDGVPQMTPGGTRLFFNSTRPAGSKPSSNNSPEIWYVDRNGDGWGEPRPLGSETANNATPLVPRAGLPSPARDGTVYFFRDFGGKDARVRLVRSIPVNGRYLDFQDLGDVINGSDDGSWDPAIAPDQSFLIFANFRRADRYGGNDLYISYRDGSGWSEPRNLGPRVNTKGDEVTPTLSPDGRTLYFYSNGIRSIPLTACEGVLPQPTQTAVPVPAPPPFAIGRQAGQFTILAFEGEEQAANDVERALLEHAPQVSRTLACDFRDPVTVELHSTQESLDGQIAARNARGHYAHSEGRRIRMVSPRQPIPNLDVPYETRVRIAVHEFVHLVNSAINPRMPLWLNEGVAVFAGPHAPYSYVCHNRFPFERTPTLRDLQRTYQSVAAADLFAFTVVEFVVAEFGLDVLNRVIRAPDPNAALGELDPDLERRWRSYMEKHYGRT